jgi:hypothetical protein
MSWPGCIVVASSHSLFVLILAAIIAFAVAWIYWSIRDIPFDAARWNAPPEKLRRTECRVRMARWMVQKHILLGKTRSQVVDMLGPSSDAIWFKSLDWECFDLYGCAFDLDFLALGIKCDHQGVVVEAAVVKG